MNAKRIETLDSLRGLAVLSVVLYHYTTHFSKVDFFPNVYNWGIGFWKGYLGVHLFFLISGFVIFMTIEKVKTSKEFLLKRFLRLFPTYWLCILITAVICLFLGQISDKFKVSIIDILGNFTMIQDLMRPVFAVKHVDGVYWSLLPELLFYGMIVILYQFNLLKHIKIIGIIWLLISVVCTYFNWSIFMAGIVLNFQYGSLFFGGIMFYLLWKNEKERKLWFNHFIILLSLTVSCFMVIFFKSKWDDCLITCFLYGIFYFFVYGKLNLQYKGLLFLGKISYPWYLLHQNIGYIILYYLHDKFGFTSGFTVIIPLLTTGMLAYLVTEYFENKIVKKIKQKLL